MFFVRSLVLLFLFFAISAYSQVNTEAIRSSKIDDGFRSRIDLLFGLNSGNSEFISGEAKLRLDYIQSNYRTFLAGELAYKEGNNAVISDKGFLHGRYIYKLDSLLEPELFIQKEFNEFVLLSDRNLLGAGVRLTLSNTDFVADSSAEIDIYLGSGIMYEMEEINIIPTQITEIIRSTNYMTITWKPSENFLLNSVTYFQVDINRLNDHRILNDTKLQFKITKAVSFVFNMNYRFDKEPPQGIREYDLELKNGITVEI
jgi:putative salt-induced outer membrane protein YdiY